MRGKPNLAITAGIAAGLLFLAGCASPETGETTTSGGSGGTTQLAAEQVLRINTGEPAGLDPSVTVTQRSLRMMELIYDTLLDYDGDNNLIPSIAESWTVSDDGLSYVFSIREAKFSDGSDITVDDVVFSLERARTSDTMSTTFAVIDSIAATGPREVTVTLTSPSRVFLNAVAAVGQAAILSEAAVSANSDYFTLPIATSGPWLLESFTPNSGAKLVANEFYWQTGYPIIQTIDYLFVADNTAMATALETGTADFAFNMRPADAVRLAGNGSIQYFEAPSAGLLSWSFDKTKPPFDNVDVRRAIAYMVPRQERLDVCWEGIGAVEFGDLIFAGQSFYSQGDSPFDVSRDEALRIASELLDGAGWVVGADGVRESKGVAGVPDGTPFAVDVPYENTWAQARCNTELLQQYLVPLGVQVTPEAYDAAQFWTDAAAGSFQFWHGGNSYATVDIYFAQTFLCEGSVNPLITRWCDPQVDELITQAQASSDAAEVTRIYRQVQDILIDQQPVVITGGQYAVIGATPKLLDYFPRADASNRALIYSSLAG